jgi:hypothetical protein
MCECPRYCKTARPTNANTTWRYLSNAQHSDCLPEPNKACNLLQSCSALAIPCLTPLAKVCNEHVVYEALRPDMVWIYNLHNLAELA